ncbi:MAG TPA: hypothetical protein VLG44_03005 [Chlamydiales bacterium]|nr:hypothetical protein [Chlamydiales bacterium]
MASTTINSINNFPAELPKVNSVRFITRKEFTAFRAMCAVAALVGFVVSVYFATKLGAAVSIIAFILAFLICPCINGFLKRHVWSPAHKSRLTPQMLEEMERDSVTVKTAQQSRQQQTTRTAETEHSHTESHTERTITPDHVEESGAPTDAGDLEETVISRPIERPAPLVLPDDSRPQPQDEKAPLSSTPPSSAYSSSWYDRCRRVTSVAGGYGSGIANGLGNGIGSAYNYLVSIRTSSGDQEPQTFTDSGESSPAHSDGDEATPPVTPRYTPPRTPRLRVDIPVTPGASPDASPDASPRSERSDHSDGSDSESESPTPSPSPTPRTTRTPQKTPRSILKTKTPEKTPRTSPGPNVTFNNLPPAPTPRTPTKPPEKPVNPPTPKAKTPQHSPERTPPSSPSPSPQPSPRGDDKKQKEQEKAERAERQKLIAEIYRLREDLRPLVTDRDDAHQIITGSDQVGARFSGSIREAMRHKAGQGMKDDDRRGYMEGSSADLAVMRAEEARLKSVVAEERARQVAARPAAAPAKKLDAKKLNLSQWLKG